MKNKPPYILRKLSFLINCTLPNFQVFTVKGKETLISCTLFLCYVMLCLNSICGRKKFNLEFCSIIMRSTKSANVKKITFTLVNLKENQITEYPLCTSSYGGTFRWGVLAFCVLFFRRNTVSRTVCVEILKKNTQKKQGFSILKSIVHNCCQWSQKYGSDFL